MKRSFIAVGATLVVIGGCGGTSGGGSEGGANTESFVVGEASVRTANAVQPSVLEGGSGISETMVAGTAISSFAMYPIQTVSNSELVYVNSGEIFTYQRGINQLILSSSTEYFYSAKFGHDGKIYLVSQSIGGTIAIKKCNYDGTGLTTLLSGAFGTSIDVAPNGSRIVYRNASGLVSSTPAGGSLVVLDSGAINGAISPDSTKVAFAKFVSGVEQIFTVPIAGGAAIQLTHSSINVSNPSWSADGAAVIATVNDAANSHEYLSGFSTIGPNTGQLFLTYTNSYALSDYGTTSPDGKYIACARASTYNSVDYSIVVQDSLGTSSQTVASSGFNPDWSPFSQPRTFIGPGGVLYSSAAGIIYSQYQNGFDSLIAFTATTPSTAKITSVGTTTNPNLGGPLAFDLHADSVTGVKYTNGYYNSVTTLTVGASDVLVTVDGGSGQVTAVAPFTAPRGVGLTTTGTGNQNTYKAKFSAIFNAKGENIAPNGASSLKLSNGKLLAN